VLSGLMSDWLRTHRARLGAGEFIWSAEGRAFLAHCIMVWILIWETGRSSWSSGGDWLDGAGSVALALAKAPRRAGVNADELG